MLPVVSIEERLAQIDRPWQPRVIGTVNDFHVKLARLDGSFVWHHHQTEDELFLVLSGTLRMHYRDADGEHVAAVRQGQLIVMPHGVEHCPVAEGEVTVLLLEPATTLNTGTEVNERTYVDPV